MNKLLAERKNMHNLTKIYIIGKSLIAFIGNNLKLNDQL